MDTVRTENVAYEPIRRGFGTRLGDAARDLWADKARLRRIAMVWGVAAVIVIAGTLYLTGGRYVSTDDAYVHAAKLMVSTDVSGLVQDVDVREGQHVKAGQGPFPPRSQAVRDRARQCQGVAGADRAGRRVHARDL